MRYPKMVLNRSSKRPVHESLQIIGNKFQITVMFKRKRLYVCSFASIRNYPLNFTAEGLQKKSKNNKYGSALRRDAIIHVQ